MGLDSSPSDFTARSLRQCMREVRHAQMARLADEAMADPRFVADMNDTMEAFCFVDAEGWPEYDDAGDEA